MDRHKDSFVCDCVLVRLLVAHGSQVPWRGNKCCRRTGLLWCFDVNPLVYWKENWAGSLLYKQVKQSKHFLTFIFERLLICSCTVRKLIIACEKLHESQIHIYTIRAALQTQSSQRGQHWEHLAAREDIRCDRVIWHVWLHAQVASPRQSNQIHPVNKASLMLKKYLWLINQNTVI